MKTTIIKGGKLIDGNGGLPIEKSIVVVQGKKILFAGDESEYPIPQGDNIELINAAGKTVMPGLVDSHVHIYVDGETSAFKSLAIFNSSLALAMKSIPRLKRTLEMGITTLRDGGSGWNWLEVGLRDAIDRGDISGPRFFTSGYHLTVTGGHGYFMPPWLPHINEQSSVHCDGPEEWRKAARLQIYNRVDNVKLVASRGFLSTTRAGDRPTASQASLEELKAATEEAHKLGIKCSSHANGHDAIMNSIEAGVDSIVHGFGMDEECAEMMVKKNVVLEATTLTIRRVMELGSGELPDAMVERAVEYWKIKEKEFAMILEKGVKIAFASDMGMAYLYHGANAQELSSLVQLGMKPMAAIVSGTKIAAQLIGVGDLVGTLEAGKIADIIVIDGDPSKDIGVLEKEDKIKMVMKDGSIIITR